MPTRAVQGAWVREKKRPVKKPVDPTVSLFPVIRYFGCRPNMPEPHLKQHDHQDFDAIETVPEKTHQRPSSRHEASRQRPSSRHAKAVEHDMRPGPSPHTVKRPTGRATAALERQLRSSTIPRHNLHALETRQYTGAQSHLRASPHVSRAMAVNMNAMTPLAM